MEQELKFCKDLPMDVSSWAGHVVQMPIFRWLVQDLNLNGIHPFNPSDISLTARGPKSDVFFPHKQGHLKRKCIFP